MVESAARTAARATRGPRAVRVSLLIPTHALPPLSYRVPERLRRRVRVGAAVVAPLSGRPRLGVVVGTERESGRSREDLVSVADELSLPPDVVELCVWAGEAAAVPLPTVLRAALPPGLDTGRYRVVRPRPDWPYRRGGVMSRAALKKFLGSDGLREAEADGRIELAPTLPERRTVEWAVVRGSGDPDLRRAPRQRELFEALKERGGGDVASALLSETGASRGVLRELVRRGAVRLVRRPEPAPVFSALGDGEVARGPGRFSKVVGRAVDHGGAFVWRTPTREQPDAVAAVARATTEGGEQALVLAPEIAVVERLVRHLRRALPAGLTVAPYHSGLERGRTAVYEAVRAGEADVVVGTRAAALLPLGRLGCVCVVDEPNEAHRAGPGYEGLPLHARDVALERGRVEGAAVFLLSPFPSLRVYAPEVRKARRIRELPERRSEGWPGVRIVDMRGSGATLSSALVAACRRVVEEGGRAGVVANRLGYATAVSCNRCGAVKRCPDCDLPLAPRDRTGLLVCGRCGRREKNTGRCGECGSDRVSPTGLAVERVREELSDALGRPVGLITADRRRLEGAPVVVGTARCVLDGEWDAIVLPDADAFLTGSGISASERSFRLLYRSAEAARELLLVQTRLPEHYALRTGVRGDYPAFAAAELPRLRALNYPPFAHLASLEFEGAETTVRRAVESRLRPALGPGVEMSAPVPRGGGTSGWRVLLRSVERPVVARVATLAARLAAETRGLKVRVDVDPEEV